MDKFNISYEDVNPIKIVDDANENCDKNIHEKSNKQFMSMIANKNLQRIKLRVNANQRRK